MTVTASTKRDARVAGILYLMNGAPAPFSLLYIPSVFTTADRCGRPSSCFRLGIAAELLSATLFIFVGQAMYRLFKGVNERLAQLLLALALISVPISFANELNRIGP